MTNLKWYRENRKLSQKELAEKAGVSIRMIQKYELGERDINKAQAMTVWKLSVALNCAVWEILEFDD